MFKFSEKQVGQFVEAFNSCLDKLLDDSEENNHDRQRKTLAEFMVDIQDIVNGQCLDCTDEQKQRMQ